MPPSKRPTAVRDIIKISIDKPMKKAILFDNKEHQ
jgi:hypothetical protein